MTDLEIHYDEEWAALYVDGKLDRVGDSYLAEERAFELLGVKVFQDDAFMRGQKTREGVAQTLEEVREYQVLRDGRRNQIEALRKKAEDLLSQAKDLEELNL